MRRASRHGRLGRRDGTIGRLDGVNRWLRRYGFLIWVVLAIGVIALNRVAPDHTAMVRGAVTETLVPAIDAAGSPFRAISAWLGAYRDIEQLQAERERLLREVQRLRERAADAARLRRENAELRALLDAGAPTGMRVIAARVVFDSGSRYARSVVVDAGTRSGVREGLGVLDSEGFIGRIVDVGANSARVLLVTDINSRIPVMVGEEGIRAILAGGVHGRPVLQFLPRGHSARPGERILTSGHGGLLPRGLPVGSVAAEGGEGAVVTLDARLGGLGFVRILAPEEEGAAATQIRRAELDVSDPEGSEQ